MFLLLLPDLTDLFRIFPALLSCGKRRFLCQVLGRHFGTLSASPVRSPTNMGDYNKTALAICLRGIRGVLDLSAAKGKLPFYIRKGMIYIWPKIILKGTVP